MWLETLYVDRLLGSGFHCLYKVSAGFHWGISKCELLRLLSLGLVDFSRKKSFDFLLGSWAEERGGLTVQWVGLFRADTLPCCLWVRNWLISPQSKPPGSRPGLDCVAFSGHWWEVIQPLCQIYCPFSAFEYNARWAWRCRKLHNLISGSVLFLEVTVTRGQLTHCGWVTQVCIYIFNTLFAGNE